MKYYSTNHKAPLATLHEAVVRGLATDRGLYMPEHIAKLPAEFFADIDKKPFNEIAKTVAAAFFGDDVEHGELARIVDDTLSFDCPVVRVTDNIHSLELFHGPTLAFKDVGARFMARLLQYFIRQEGRGEEVNVLVATSGDTGSAVANGFLGVEGIHVYVLYPKGKVSKIQECQFTTLGRNITAIEVDGVFDDCQALVKSAFMDADLNAHMKLTSANSINVARFLPQAFYYFNAYARLKSDNLVVCVPSGNFGNITAGLFAHRMGLPIKRFIAANNANDIFYKYLQTGKYEPKPSKQTIANAMDVGDPSNFARIIDLYGGDYARITSLISGATFTDEQIREAMKQCRDTTGYTLDPHGACGYRALCPELGGGLRDGETGVFLETAHPAKFKDTVEQATGAPVELPERLAAFMQGKKRSVPMTKTFADFKAYLMEQ